MRIKLLFLPLAISLFAANSPKHVPITPPLFEPNQGQAPPPVLYLARDARGRMEITASGVDFRINSSKVSLRFPGAKPTPAHGQNQAEAITNLFLGNNPNTWKHNIPNYRQVLRPNLYPGIDLLFHGARGALEFDFILAPHANPALPALAFNHPAKITKTGDLEIESLRLPAPVAYQVINGLRHNIPCNFERRANQTIGFHLGNYNPAYSLTIDPTINYLSYFGGSGSELLNTLAVDSSGNMYVAGQTNSANLPVSNGAAQTLRRGSSDAFIAKFNPNGNLVYTTLLGGEQADEINSIAVDSQGSVYFGGVSLSTNFPLANAYQSTKRSPAEATSAFYGKLNPTGTALVYSSYIGGELGEDLDGVAVDSAGNLFLVGSTYSDQYPVTSNSFQPRNNGLENGFVTKVAPTGDRLVYSTYIGGELIDQLKTIAIDTGGNAYVGGATSSNNYPLRNAAQQTRRTGGAGIDACITKLNPNGSDIVFSTYLGGNGNELIQAIAVGSDGSVAVVGNTNSSDMPLGPSPIQRTLAGGQDMFVHKFTPVGDGITFGTLFGSPGEERGFAVAIDPSGAVYVGGITNSLSLSTVSGQQPTSGGGIDAFYLRLNPGGTQVQMSSYFGSTGSDQLTAMVADPAGKIYIGGYTSSANLPTVPGAQQRGISGSSDGFILIIEPDRNTSDAGSLLLSNSRLTFTGTPGTAIARQSFNISPVTGNPAWTIDVATLTGGAWLSATPRAASGPATVSVDVNTAGLAAGSYTGTITVNNPSVNERQVVNVTLQLGGGPGAVPNNGVVSAATFTGGGVAPGLIVTIFGTNIGPPTLTSSQIVNGRLATTLAETRVLFDGDPAPLVYVSSSQISAIVPYAVASRITTSLQVEYRGARTNAVSLNVVDTAPGLFTANSSGRGPGAILNQDASVNTTSNPARPGSVIILYGTGEGITDPVGQDGQLATSVYPKPRQPVTVRIGGRDAEVVYAGAAPGLVAGVFQINVKVPDATPTGAQPVVVQIGAAASPADVTVAVQR